MTHSASGVSASSINRYWKAVVAAVGFLVTVIQAAATDPAVAAAAADDNITGEEWWRIIIAGATAVLVYSVPNMRPAGLPHNPRMSEQD